VDTFFLLGSKEPLIELESLPDRYESVDEEAEKTALSADILGEISRQQKAHRDFSRALAGRSADLLEQRRIENAYLEATGQTRNMIFQSVAGNDVDVFTIGFHKNLEAFAATDEERESAAKAAGFKDRADLSFYLRSLISGHHDTLAVRVD
jgi:hypothetical protein